MASWAGGVTVATAMLEQADQVLERRAIAETADKVQVVLETSNRKANYSSADLLRNMGVPTLSGKKVRVVVHSPRHPQPDVGPRVRAGWPWGRGLGKGCQAGAGGQRWGQHAPGPDLDGYDLELAVVKLSPYAAADKLPQVPTLPNPRA
jgi:hypothetical protein